MPLSRHYQSFVTKALKLVPLFAPEPISPRRAHEQDASFFYRLPLELREIIWRQYFGKHAVHVRVLKSKRLYSIECLLWNIDDDYEKLAHYIEHRDAALCDHISLLLTCKRIYFDCFPLLYRETYFDFSHNPSALTAMCRRLPASHVASISKVHLVHDINRPLYLDRKDHGEIEMEWVNIWDTLASMKGLQWLRVVVTSPEYNARELTEREWTLWEGIRKVAQPAHFELVLPFPAAASTREETLPCTIIRQVPTLVTNPA
ncbi:hypothetical protein QQS21_004577 [Conoideocrella luteorostrata]|uniref:DUF7730 domain-containing protein n=1 Tax=Conoideocrella luteorostrata TaxID=1105319 RepID=A0AAJ0FZS3_9HYPO|nr:hypothetical protein QQS21_004577 [Conoideocrella luteorostrata]